MNPVQARNLFPITKRQIYLDHAGAGTTSYRVEASLSGLAAELGGRRATSELTQRSLREACRSLARLANVPSETMAVARDAATAMAGLARGIEWEPGDNVVLREDVRDEAPCWAALAERGVELRRVPSLAGHTTADAVVAHMDGRTRAVVLPHVDAWNGACQDVWSVGRECDRRGILFALDASHSLGVLEMDLSALPVDYLVADAGRWLMGPAGAAVRYGRPELLRRLGNGAAAPPLPRSAAADATALVAAVDLLVEVGTAVVETRTLALARQLADGLCERGYELVPPGAKPASGIVGFRRPGRTAVEVMRDLQAAGIVAAAPSDFVRLSPHFYNTEEEIARVLDVLAPQGALA
jgi:cysteine desulfurase / selenocysteine lyase